MKDTIAWAYVGQGNTLTVQARTKTGEEADKLVTLAGEKYAAALVIKPDKHEAFYNWGYALANHAKTETGESASKLQKLAEEKIAEAIKL